MIKTVIVCNPDGKIIQLLLIKKIQIFGNSSVQITQVIASVRFREDYYFLCMCVAAEIILSAGKSKHQYQIYITKLFVLNVIFTTLIFRKTTCVFVTGISPLRQQ
jgi:hypothetical protein